MKFNTLFTLTTFIGHLAAIPTYHNSDFSNVGISSLPYDKQIISACTEPNTVGLAFDDGPHIYTDQLLDLLHQYGANATFFVNGVNYGHQIDSYKSVLQREVKDGHQIASHTWDHKWELDKASNKTIMWEMTTLDDKLDDLIGLRPTYMRPPNLATSERMLDVLKDYHVITTNLNTDDSGGNLDWSKSCFDDGLEEGGSLILAHDTKDIAIALATYMLDKLKEKNITGVTVGDCLGDPKINWYRKAGDDFRDSFLLQNKENPYEKYIKTGL